jgi:hypothetical protein
MIRMLNFLRVDKVSISTGGRLHPRTAELSVKGRIINHLGPDDLREPRMDGLLVDGPTSYGCNADRLEFSWVSEDSRQRELLLRALEEDQPILVEFHINAKVVEPR